jgi:hypothetical protein
MDRYPSSDHVIRRGVDEAMACRDVLAPATREPGTMATFLGSLSALVDRTLALLKGLVRPARSL